jgi:DNA-binding MarR family transcriptional regulator
VKECQVKPHRSTNHDELSILVADVFDLMNNELVARLIKRGHSSLKASYRLVFRAIGSGTAVSVGDLARSSGVTTQAISQLVKEMETLNLVSRSPDPNDRRVSVVSLTPLGRNEYKTVQSIHAEFENEWRELLSEGRAEQLRRSLSELRSHLN